MFRKHSKVISVILSLALIATMCCMSAVSFAAADGNFYVVGDMQNWKPATADIMSDNGDGTWTKVYTDLPIGKGGFKVIDAQSEVWDDFHQYNDTGSADFGGANVSYEITEEGSTMTIIFSETEMKVLSWDITTGGEQPTGDTTPTDVTEDTTGTTDATEDTTGTTDATEDTTAATDATEDTTAGTQPTTAPEAGSVTINGEKFNTGDIIAYTAYLKASEVAAGINVQVDYDGALLKVQEGSKKEVIPVASTGSCVLNFTPIDGTSKVLFNSNDIDEGYDFTGDKTVLITLKFEVIGTSGSGSIQTEVKELLGMTNADKENLPITDYKVTDEMTLAATPTETTAPDTTAPDTTAPDTTAPDTTAPTKPAGDRVIINGVEFTQGQTVFYTAYLKASEIAAGINVHVDYDGALVKVSDKTLGLKKKDVIPIAYTGSSVLNFEPIDGSSQVLFNANDIDEGYDFTGEKPVLITLEFDVIAKSGTGTITTNLVEFLGMTNADNQNLPITDYTLWADTVNENPPTPTETTPVPTETTPVPTETTPVPTETTPVPTETTPVPTETTPVPTETTPVPTETTPIPTETTPVTSDPTDATGTQPTDAPTDAPTAAPTSAPTQAPTQAPTNGGSSGGVATGDSTSVAMLLAVLMLAAGVVVVARKRVKG